MADELVTMDLVATIEGVTVVRERAVIPLKLLAATTGQDHLTNLIRQNVLKLVPSLGVRNADALRARVGKLAAELEQGEQDD